MTNAEPRPRNERTIDQVIGANIHTLMWNRGETQTRVAPLWGMDQTTLSAKLRGKRPWYAAEIDSAARHYGVTRDSLFSELPHLDSNQEPIGYANRDNLTVLADYQQTKVDAHTAVRTSKVGNGKHG